MKLFKIVAILLLLNSLGFISTYAQELLEEEETEMMNNSTEEEE